MLVLRAALVGDVMQLLHYAEAGFGQLWLLGTLARRVPICYRFDAMLDDVDGSWTHCFVEVLFFSMLHLRGEPHELQQNRQDNDGSIPNQITENHNFYHSIYENSRFGENLRPEQWLNLLDLLRLWRLWEPSAPIIVSAFGCRATGGVERNDRTLEDVLSRLPEQQSPKSDYFMAHLYQKR